MNFINLLLVKYQHQCCAFGLEATALIRNRLLLHIKYYFFWDPYPKSLPKKLLAFVGRAFDVWTTEPVYWGETFEHTIQIFIRITSDAWIFKALKAKNHWISCTSISTMKMKITAVPAPCQTFGFIIQKWSTVCMYIVHTCKWSKFTTLTVKMVLPLWLNKVTYPKCCWWDNSSWNELLVGNGHVM